MEVKTWMLTLGLGAAIGAVAILAMPKSNPTRRLATKAADKVEDLAWQMSDKFTQEFDL